MHNMLLFLSSVNLSISTNQANYSEPCFGVSQSVSFALESAGTTSSGTPDQEEMHQKQQEMRHWRKIYTNINANSQESNDPEIMQTKLEMLNSETQETDTPLAVSAGC